jgi:ATP-dependent helicase/nuclease subunit A
MSRIGHKMILASAGSGKTYALTNRFVQLLAKGAPPERIVALTFTRKAAGEFFDEILNKLARAARDPKVAAKTGAEIGEPQLVAADFLVMLRAMVGAMHRLSLGTLDGFFARVVRAFPLELGLGGDFEILQEHGARLERQRVLRQLFARTGGELDEAQKEFIEAFKRATFGAEEKRLSARLDRFIDEHQTVFLEAPEAWAWGNERRIWPDGTPWLQAGGDAKGEADVVRQWAPGACANEKQRARWDDFLAALEAWTPGAEVSDPLKYLLPKALEVWAALGEEDVELVIERKKQVVPVATGAALRVLVRQLFAGELNRRLEMTRGIYTVLRGYEAIYNDRVRRAGKLTFADVQRLLMPETGAPRLGTGAEAVEGGRLLVDWRLDAKFDHWLLDEFQDTSHGQWSVLRNLIDEAVQDPEGRRSLFYVGDVKQAIYAWRGGDPRLFREIFDHYNAVQPGTIEEGRLDDSWRSGPTIIATVNRLFGNAEALARLVPASAAERWTREWRDHVSARPELRGQVAWLHGADEEERAALTLRLLMEINPLERGLSVAVLVQSNEMATWLADYLRREGGLQAMAASDLHVCTDNPLTTAVLALLQAAAHPGDRFAWEHAMMTPLAGLVAGEGEGARGDLTRGVLREVHEDGFARTVETWLRRLDTVLDAKDLFSRERARQLIEAAQVFDATGSRDVAEFVQFAGRHVVRDAESAAGVRVMTIHKSKGLGFDVVVLPDLEGNSLGTRRRDGLAVQRSEARAVEWVLDLPPKLYCDNDAVLTEHTDETSADAAYEKLCLFYVATTRAKRAMYLITKPVGEKSRSDNFPKLLTETLSASGAAGTAQVAVGNWASDAVYAEGDADWFATEGMREPVDDFATDRAGMLSMKADTVAVERHPARTPSGTKGGVVAGVALFGASGSGAASFGTAVHRALSEVEWGGATPEMVQSWQNAGLGAAVIMEATACLQADGLREVFAHKAGAEVWRERRFEIVMDGAWITGVFDRVVLERTENGILCAVTVYDFKTDRVGVGDAGLLAERYTGQMAVYQRAAARLAGVKKELVRCVLVATMLRQLVEVNGSGAD